MDPYKFACLVISSAVVAQCDAPISPLEKTLYSVGEDSETAKLYAEQLKDQPELYCTARFFLYGELKPEELLSLRDDCKTHFALDEVLKLEERWSYLQAVERSLDANPDEDSTCYSIIKKARLEPSIIETLMGRCNFSRELNNRLFVRLAELESSVAQQ